MDFFVHVFVEEWVWAWQLVLNYKAISSSFSPNSKFGLVNFRLRIQRDLSTILGDIKQISNSMTFFLEQLIIGPILWYIEHKFPHISKPIFLNFLNILTFQNLWFCLILFLNFLYFLSGRLSCWIADCLGRWINWFWYWSGYLLNSLFFRFAMIFYCFLNLFCLIQLVLYLLLWWELLVH